MWKKMKVLACVWIAAVLLSGCASQPAQESVEEMTWEEILTQAEGTTVSFYGWGGSPLVNTWLDETVAQNLQTQYGIRLERVPMNIDDILNKLLSEKQLDSQGTIDVVWINGENFATARENGLLYGPFTDRIPNFKQYVDENSADVMHDFGYQVEGYEAPFGKAQFVLIGDSEKVETFPADHEALLAMAKANPGKITYPAPPDFTGSAFVRNLISEIVGMETLTGLEADRQAVQTAIQPAIDYFLELKPYLWRQGETYPATTAQLDQMFGDGEVLLTMSYNPNHVANKISTGDFPQSAQAFLLDKGTIGNTHFLAIPQNAPNKAAALAVIHTILSPEIQASKFDAANWGDLPVLEFSKLSEAETELFDAVASGQGVLPPFDLLEKRIPELPAKLVPLIEAIWMEQVPGAVK